MKKKQHYKNIKKSRWEFVNAMLILGGVVAISSAYAFYQYNTSQSNERALAAPAESKILPVGQVCMVNNEFLGKDQIPVQFDEKTYYGCCQMRADRIKNDRAVRYATDPVTGEEVDKATSLITLNPSGTGVLYFGSEKSYRKFYHLQ